MGTGSHTIDVKALQPAGAADEIVRRQQADAQRRIDPETGLLRRELSVEVDCYVCHSKDSDMRFTKQGFRFVQCRTCGLVYVNPRLCDEEIHRLYAEGGRWAYQFEHFYLPSADYRKETLYPGRLETIEKRIGTVGRLLDVGSSTGHFLLCAKERGWEVHGVELAEYAAHYARETLGLENVRCVDLLEAGYDRGFFDAATLWDVIEHVTDPGTLMKHIHGLLCPGGMVFIHTPHFDCFEGAVLGPDAVNLVGDYHPACYTKSSLRRLVADAGFDVEELSTFGLDIAHIEDVYGRQGKHEPLAFLSEHRDALQACIDASGQGCYLACYARRGSES